MCVFILCTLYLLCVILTSLVHVGDATKITYWYYVSTRTGYSRSIVVIAPNIIVYVKYI